jgi:hypothetical protein
MRHLYYRWTIVYISCWENEIFCVTSHCVRFVCYWPCCPCSVLSATVSVSLSVFRVSAIVSVFVFFVSTFVSVSVFCVLFQPSCPCPCSVISHNIRVRVPCFCHRIHVRVLCLNLLIRVRILCSVLRPSCPYPCTVLPAILSVSVFRVLCYQPSCPCSVLADIVSQTVSTSLSSLNVNSPAFRLSFETCQMQNQKSFACYYLKQPKSRFLNPHSAGASSAVIACLAMFRLHGRQASRRSCRDSTAATFYRSEILHSEKLSKLIVCRITQFYNLLNK